MITELTEKQKARFQEFIDKWTAIGLSTEPANRKEAEKGIVEAYKIAGLEKPKIVWCESPLSQGLTRYIVTNEKLKTEIGDSVWASVRNSVGDSVRDSVRDSVWASVRDSVRDSVWAGVRNSVGDSVRAGVRNSVWDSVWDSVRDSVRAGVRNSVWASVGDSVGTSVRDSGYGQHDANWLAFYDYFREVNGLKKETQKLSGLFKIAKNANWFLPHEKICWICERHNYLNKDDQGKLHNYDKAALTYPDGFSLWYIHGVKVPEKYVTTPVDEIKAKDILAETNAEVRMAVIKKVGFDRLEKQLKSKKISKSKTAELLEFDLGNNVKVRALKVKWDDKHEKNKKTLLPVPSTRERFGDRCPDDINDCEQVRLWTMGLTTNDTLIKET